MACATVEHATEVATAADGPVHGVRSDSQHRFDFFHKLKWIAGFAVKLVHESEDGNMAQGTNLEELFGLGFYALCGVDYHNGSICGHESAIGIFGKVLVSGGIQDIYAAAIVVKLQNRRGYGNTAFLFDIHPVGNGVLGAAFPLNRTGGLDAAGV